MEGRWEGRRSENAWDNGGRGWVGGGKNETGERKGKGKAGGCNKQKRGDLFSGSSEGEAILMRYTKGS